MVEMIIYDKCDYCNGNAYAIRIDSNTDELEVLCKGCVKGRNVDQIDKKGVYIPIKLIKLVNNQENPIIIESSVDTLIKKIIESKTGQKISLETIH